MIKNPGEIIPSNDRDTPDERTLPVFDFDSGEVVMTNPEVFRKEQADSGVIGTHQIPPQVIEGQEKMFDGRQK